MNERIREFAEQAGMKSPDGFKLTVSHMTTFQLEKFAELIVKECIDIIAPYTVRMSRPGEECLHPIQEIKKHFGVK